MSGPLINLAEAVAQHYPKIIANPNHLNDPYTMHNVGKTYITLDYVFLARILHILYFANADSTKRFFYYPVPIADLKQGKIYIHNVCFATSYLN